MNDEKNYIIDPLTALCKVALLYFMPEKTRIAIGHHVLYIQEYNCYQWIERIKNGDSRTDISNLYIPLLKIIKWYILQKKDSVKLDENTIENVNTIIKFAIKGLIKLRKSVYNSDMTVIIIIQYLINMLNTAIEGKWDDSFCIGNESDNFILSEQIKNNVDPHIINSIAKMLLDADIETSQDNINVLVECIHKLLIVRDGNFVKMMRQINTNI